VTNYPIKYKKKKSKVLYTATCIIENNDPKTNQKKYLLCQRPVKGLLASFWEFPSLDVEEDPEKNEIVNLILKHVSKNLEKKIAPKNIQKENYLGQVTHIFTHINQTMSVSSISISREEDEIETTIDSYKWVTSDQILGMAISEGTKKCLRLFQTGGSILITFGSVKLCYNKLRRQQ